MGELVISLRALCYGSWRMAAVLSLVMGFLGGFAPPGESAAGVRLVIDGRRITVSPPPVIIDDRTLVPVRVVSETLGASVGWNGQSRTVTVTRGARRLKLRIGNRLVDLAGGAPGSPGFVLTDVPPRIIEDRTFIPLRLVTTALGVSVRWDGSTRTVFVDSRVPPSAAPPSAVAITTVRAGQVIADPTDLRVTLAGDLPARATEVRFILLDPETGRGPIVARGNVARGNVTGGNTPAGTYRLLPDPLYHGRRALAVAVYDEAGRFLAGEVVPVEVAVVPRVSLEGLSPGQKVEGTVSLAVALNFLATHVRYELTNPETGEVSELARADPQGQFSWTPRPGDNGERTLRAVAYDRLGQAHYSAAIPVTVAVERRLALTGVSAGRTIDGPVTLGLSFNFTAREVRYLLRDPISGNEEVLARLQSPGSHRWLPAPGQAGKRELLVEVIDDQGKSYRSEPVPVEVRVDPGVFIETVGPNQVLAGNVPLRSLTNVPLARIDYRLIDPKTGSEHTIAGGTDPRAEYTWTPRQNDAGSWRLQALGYTPNGDKVISEALPVRVHVGPLYGPMPVIEKDRFIDFAAGLARPSQARTGMSAALQVAQAILETGWGQSVPVDKYTGQPSYNLFGIKGEGPAGSITSNTWEEYNGVVYRVDARFRAYHNPAESWEDHKRFLLTGSRYEPFRAVMHDSILGAWALKRAGYATDSQYPLKLIDLIKRYELYHLDEVET